MFSYTVTDSNGKVTKYSANSHSIEDGLLNLNYTKSFPFLTIKNWISVSVDKLNELGEMLNHEEFKNLQMNLNQYKAYDRLYA